MFNKKNIDLEVELEKKEELLEEEQNCNKKLKRKVEDYEDELEELINEKKELQRRLNDEEYNNLSSKKEIAKAEQEKELTEMQLEDIKKILEEYRQLPDLKNMIDNLSSLTTPSINKLVDLVKGTDFGELVNFNERVSSIERKLDTIIEVFSTRRMF